MTKAEREAEEAAAAAELEREQALRDQLAVRVAQGQRVTAAARALGVNERSARRWANDRKFIRTVQSLRNRIVGTAAGRLARLATKAVGTLDKLLDSPDEATRLKAVHEVLANAAAMNQAATASLIEQMRAFMPELDGKNHYKREY